MALRGPNQVRPTQAAIAKASRHLYRPLPDSPTPAALAGVLYRGFYCIPAPAVSCVPPPPRRRALQEDRARAHKRKFSASDAAPSSNHVAREVAAGHMKPLGREQVAAERDAREAAHRDARREARQQQQQPEGGNGHAAEKAGEEAGHRPRRAPLFTGELLEGDAAGGGIEGPALQLPAVGMGRRVVVKNFEAEAELS